MQEKTLATVKNLVKLYYGQEDEYYINLAMEEIERGFTVADIKEMMEQSEL